MTSGVIEALAGLHRAVYHLVWTEPRAIDEAKYDEYLMMLQVYAQAVRDEAVQELEDQLEVSRKSNTW